MGCGQPRRRISWPPGLLTKDGEEIHMEDHKRPRGLGGVEEEETDDGQLSLMLSSSSSRGHFLYSLLTVLMSADFSLP